MPPAALHIRRAGLAASIVILVIATLIAGYMVVHHTQRATDPFYSRVCNPEQTLLGLPLDCDDVAESTFGFVAGVPISVVGVAFYMLLIALAAIGMSRRTALAHRAVVLLWGGALFSVLYALFLLSAQVLIIHALCPFCLSLYVLHAGLFIATRSAIGGDWRGGSLSFVEVLRRGWRDPLILGAALAFVLAVGAGAYLVANGSRAQDPEVADLVAKISAVPIVSLPSAAADASHGPSDAPYVVVEFSDFFCPYCREAANTLRDLDRQHPGAMRIDFRHFPLDADCNPYVLTSLHPGACLAARAAICAGRQGKFWAMHDWLFDGGRRASPESFREATLENAASLGLNRDALVRCLDDEQVAASILDDIELAVELGVRTTPSFLLNGRPLFRKPVELGAGAVTAIDWLIQAGAARNERP